MASRAEKPISPQAVADATGARSRHRFCVLLGADHVGKTTLLQHLAKHTDWRIVDCDASAGPQDPALNELRAAFERFLAGSSTQAPELILSGLQLSVMYLRVQIARELERGHVIVDSYYYKMLSKCLLKGLYDPAIIELWRKLPAPDAVIMLRADPEVLWQRSGEGARVHAFEVHGAEPSRQGYLQFQADLMECMTGELRGLPAHQIDANADFATVAARVQRCLRRLRADLPMVRHG